MPALAACELKFSSPGHLVQFASGWMACWHLLCHFHKHPLAKCPGITQVQLVLEFTFGRYLHGMSVPDTLASVDSGGNGIHIILDASICALPDFHIPI